MYSALFSFYIYYIYNVCGEHRRLVNSIMRVKRNSSKKNYLPGTRGQDKLCKIMTYTKNNIWFNGLNFNGKTWIQNLIDEGLQLRKIKQHSVLPL